MSDHRYLDVNRANWDARTPIHAAAYGISAFADDQAHLSDVVRFDLPRLPELTGLRGVHLQCHLGTDTISLSRLGARMSGLDFSPAAVTEARALAAASGADIDYVVADVYDAPAAFSGRTFDFVFTGIGALCWLPDIRRWAQAVSALLERGGMLFLRDQHPVAWALDDERTDALVLRYPYFETEEPTVWHDDTTYVESDARIPADAAETREWNHGLGETVTALLDAGLEITRLEEHESAPWDALPGQLAPDGPFGEWQFVGGRKRVPLTFTLHARKR